MISVFYLSVRVGISPQFESLPETIWDFERISSKFNLRLLTSFKEPFRFLWHIQMAVVLNTGCTDAP